MTELTIQELVETWSTPARPAIPVEHSKSELELEWPSDRLRSFVTDYLRESCQWALKRREELEAENRDARIKGVSYRDRKKYSVQLDALNGLFDQWKKTGIEYNRNNININDFIRDEYDLLLIRDLGIEYHIKSVLIHKRTDALSKGLL